MIRFKFDSVPRFFALSLAAWLTLLLGIAVTAGLFVWASRLEFAKTERDFQHRAEVQFGVVKEGMDDAVDEIERINQLFVAVDPVSREQFHAFIQPFLVNAAHVQGFSFERIVTAAQRPAYEAGMRRQFPHFAITELIDGKPVPAGARERYRVVDYLEPLAGNETAFGLDAATIQHQNDATNRARDTGMPSATLLFTMQQNTQALNVFSVVIPVYLHGATPGDVGSRRRTVVGYTVGVFRAEELVKNILQAGGILSAPDVSVSVFCGEREDDASLAFHYGATQFSDGAASRLPAWLFAASAGSYSHAFEVGGAPWHMRVSAAAMTKASDHIGSLILLGVGLLLSAIAAMYMQRVTSRSQRVQRLVDDRTAELQSANERLVRDIAARERAEQALRLRDRALEASTSGVVITSAEPPDFQVEYVNPAFERMTGYAAAEVIGRPVGEVRGADSEQPGFAELREARRGKREAHVTVHNYRKDGSMYWIDVHLAPVNDLSGDASHFVSILNDVTETKRYQAELEFHASRDALTGLPNRNLLHDRMQQAIAYGDRYRRPIWVIAVNIDRFGLVHDTAGRQAGDDLLKAIAARLVSAVRESDTVARVGGDEFMLVLPERTDQQLDTGAVQRVLEAVAQPFEVGGKLFFLTCGIGVAVYPIDGGEAETLIKHAGIALHRVKEKGGNNFQFYMDSMNRQATERLRMVSDMRDGIEREEFVLCYQPQMDFRSGRVVGMEALIRWNHPELGLLQPDSFIGPAEESGMIVPIGAWVIRTACLQNKVWQEAGLGKFRIAVNLSARQFAQPDLAQSIVAALQESGLEPCYLDLELTESMVMTDVDQAREILSKFKSLGVQLSIDDFGTGYSSLAYLKGFPIDALKIDRSFVRDIAVDTGDAAIVKAIVSMAHTLGIRVIAEGAETEQQCDFLRQNMCDEMQGFFISKPLPQVEIETMLRQEVCLPARLLRWQEPTRTLLIVDDEANIVAALKRLLRRDNYRILTANSGQEALDILAQDGCAVDVIMSDQRMPGMTGVEFLRKAKNLYPDTVRIVLSGYTELQSVTDAVNEGAIYKFLTKPWDDAQLREHIEKAFRHKQLADENLRLHLEVQTANQELAESNRKMSDMLKHMQQKIASVEAGLFIAEEVLQKIPLPAIGLNEYGAVAFANEAAQTLFREGEQIIGADAARLLPELSRASCSDDKEERCMMTLNGASFEVVARAMGDASLSWGKFITLTPCEAKR